MSEKMQNNEQIPETGGPSDEKDRSEAYRFLDQKIKKRPVNKKLWLTRILGVIAAGVCIGLIASLVFSFLHPELRETGKETATASSAKITIPADEEPEETPTPEPTEIPSPTPTETPEPTPEATSEEQPEEDPVQETEETASSGEETETEPEEPSEQETNEATGEEEPQTEEPQTEEPETPLENGDNAEQENPDEEDLQARALEAYKAAYREMVIVAEKAEHSLVQVIGITDEMDYFDQGYENQRRVSGTAVAKNENDLFILTEYRVVDQVERIQVVFFDGSMADATFQRNDPETGLAVLKVSLGNLSESTREELTVASLGNSYLISRGEPVMAIGSPTGYSGSMVYGVITSASGKGSVVDREYSLLTTDITDHKEGSGVLIDMNGEIIGILTHAFGEDNGSLTALAISQAKELIQDLSNNEDQTYVGIIGQDVTQAIADRTGIPRGVLVTEVVLDSPASMAGIKEMDVIVKIGEDAIETMRDYHRFVDVLLAEEPVAVTAMRRGAEGFAEVVFEVLPEKK